MISSSTGRYFGIKQASGFFCGHCAIVAHMRVGLGGRLEDVRRDAPARERLAELHPEERAGRVPRRRRVVVRLHVADHGGVRVGHGRVDEEIVVVDDQRDLVAHALAELLHHAPDAVDIIAGLHLHAFEIQEHGVALLVVADTLGEAETEQCVLELHRHVVEDAWIHGAWGVHDGHEVHLRKDVTLDVDARCDLLKHHAFGGGVGRRSAP